MAELSGVASAPGIVHLFGEYGTTFGEPALAFALDQRLTISVKQSEYDFFIVDGFKLDQKRHSYFFNSIQKLWDGGPLDITTSSQIPWLTGVGTRDALSMALTALLMEKNRVLHKEKKLDDPKEIAGILAQQAFIIENNIDGPISPLGTSTSLLGGIVLMYDIPVNAFWSIQDQKFTWYIHQMDTLDNVDIVLGFLKEPETVKYSAEQPKPLFDSPEKIKSLRGSQNHDPSTLHQKAPESIFITLQRLLEKSGFMRDIVRDIGKNTRAGVQALTDHNLGEVGSLMSKQQNLLTILGVYPPALKKLAEAAEDHSYGVALAGANGDVIIALTSKPKLVAHNIEKAGGVAIITKVTKQGLTLE